MTESDRELLELAAKASGIPIIPCTCRHERWPFKHDEARSGESGHWNPLEDDGDALRLAVKLRMDVKQWNSLAIAAVAWNRHAEENTTTQCPYAATRRAIVRAAAAIARATHKESQRV